MNQIIYIFRKDVRQHWYVIVLSVVILFGFARNQPNLWVPKDAMGHLMVRQSSEWLTPLVVIFWLFLIVRVVQGESLVGDRQFWITRPYEWKRLLTAKALFFVAFINVPLLIAQVVLLRIAGFAPTSYVRGLLWMQFLWILILILPVTTLATVTSSFGQAVLVALGIPLFLIGFPFLSSVLLRYVIPVAESIQELLLLLVVVGACVAVVVLQYARRRTLESRLLLLDAAAAILVIAVASAYQPPNVSGYPPPSSGQRHPVQLAFDPASQTTNEGSPTWGMGKDNVEIRIPLLVSGMAQNSVLRIQGIMVDIEAPGGLRWNSSWQGYNSVVLPAQSYTDTSFAMDKGFFERVKSISAKLHIWFALTTFRAKEVHRIVAGADEFTAAAGTLCSIPNKFTRQPNTLLCRSALKLPFLLVTTLSEETTCPLRSFEEAGLPRTFFASSQWDPDSSPAEFGISPVNMFDLFFSSGPRIIDPRRVLCPGTPLTFRTFDEAQRTSSEVTIDGIHLVDYQLKELQPSIPEE